MSYFDEAEGGDLKDAFDELVLEWPGVTSETTFGCPSYRADGTLFAVVVTHGVALTQLGEAERERVKRSFDAGPFDAGGRTVTRWVHVPVEDASELEALRAHVRASYERALGDETESGEDS